MAETGTTPSYDLVKQAYYAAEYEGQSVDLDALTSAERRTWQTIADRDRRLRDLYADTDYETADKEFPDGWHSV